MKHGLFSILLNFLTIIDMKLPKHLKPALAVILLTAAVSVALPSKHQSASKQDVSASLNKEQAIKEQRSESIEENIKQKVENNVELSKTYAPKKTTSANIKGSVSKLQMKSKNASSEALPTAKMQDNSTATLTPVAGTSTSTGSPTGGSLTSTVSPSPQIISTGVPRPGGSHPPGAHHPEKKGNHTAGHHHPEKKGHPPPKRGGHKTGIEFDVDDKYSNVTKTVQQLHHSAEHMAKFDKHGRYKKRPHSKLHGILKKIKKTPEKGRVTIEGEAEGKKMPNHHNHTHHQTILKELKPTTTSNPMSDKKDGEKRKKRHINAEHGKDDMKITEKAYNTVEHLGADSADLKAPIHSFVEQKNPKAYVQNGKQKAKQTTLGAHEEKDRESGYFDYFAN